MLNIYIYVRCLKFWFMMETKKTKFVKVQEIEELDNLDAVKKRQATDRTKDKQLTEKLSPQNKRHCFGRH